MSDQQNTALQTNVFEWCWEYGPTSEEDKATLMRLAFKAVGDSPSLHPLMLVGTDPHSVGRLVAAGYLGFDHEDQGVGFPAYEKWLLPHTLTLSTWDGEPYDGEDAHIWNQATIECPHQPATETMPCAVWEPCGCPVDVAEAPLYDGGNGDGNGPCARSAIRMHHYVEGKTTRPVASCWALDWEASIADQAFELGLMPGTHLVRPWWDGDQVQLELVEPQVVRHG